MRPRVPVTLWRRLAAELGRLVLVTTTVLVVVLSFSATVKWFIEGKLTLADTLWFMVLAVPPMLHYALPFAAGFSATLSYHRMEEDHERIGAHAGGVSHGSLLTPAVLVGFTLFGLLLLLNQELSPRFLREMEEMLTDRVGRAIESTVEAGEPIEFGRWVIHADRVERLPQEADAEPGAPYERLALFGVGVIETDHEGRAQKELTASRAWVFLYRGGLEEDQRSPSEEGDRDGQVWVVMWLDDPFSFSRDGMNSRSERIKIVESVPERFDDDPKFLTAGELSRAYHDPDSLNIIAVAREDLAHHEAKRQIVEWMNENLRDEGRVELRDAVGRTITLRGTGLRWQGPGWRVGERDERVRLERSDGLVAESRAVLVDVDIGENRHERRLDVEIEMTRVATGDASDSADVELEPESGRKELAFGELRPAIDPLPRLLEMSSAELLREVAPRLAPPNPDTYVGPPARDLSRKIESLRREIVSKRHERVAMAMASLVMVLTGGITAMRLGKTLPLVVYLWSFFPALAAVLTVSTGQQMAHEMGWTGLLVLWGGIVGLGLYSLVAYVGLIRH